MILTSDRIIALLVDADLHTPDAHTTIPTGFTAENDTNGTVVLHYLGESTGRTQSKLDKAARLLAQHRYRTAPRIRDGRFCLEISEPQDGGSAS